MTVSTTNARRRLSLSLDTAMPFDAWILNRLFRLPSARRQEWLRGLLIQGFQAECRLLRELDGEGGVVMPPMPDRAVVARPAVRGDDLSGTDERAAHQEPEQPNVERPTAGGEVSFAMLRKVIG